MTEETAGDGTAGSTGDRTTGGAGEPATGTASEEAPGDCDADGEDAERSTRDEIRWAAFDVLVEEGYDSFTTQAVADRADVSQSLVHYYYDTKADLVFAMFSNGLDLLAEEIEARVDADDPRERLLELARYTLRDEGDADVVEFSRMLLEVEAQAPYDERLRETVSYNTAFLRDYVVDAVEAGVESGRFRPVDPEPFAAVYLGAMRSGRNLRAIFDGGDHVDQILAGLEAIVDDYLVAGDDP